MADDMKESLMTYRQLVDKVGELPEHVYAIPTLKEIVQIVAEKNPALRQFLDYRPSIRERTEDDSTVELEEGELDDHMRELIAQHGLKAVSNAFTLAVVSSTARTSLEEATALAARLQEERDYAHKDRHELYKAFQAWRRAYEKEAGKSYPDGLTQEVLTELGYPDAPPARMRRQP